MASIFTMNYGVRSSARGVEAKGGLKAEEKVWIGFLMPTHCIIRATLSSGG